MAKIRIDKLVGGNAVWHEHGAEDIPALSGYVPYTGATGNVQLGTHDLLAGRLDIGGAGEFGNIRQVRIHSDVAYSGLRITNATTGVGSNKGFEMSTSGINGVLNLYEDGDMKFYVHNVERMVLDNAGNLDIDGDYSGVDVNLTGNIYQDDNKYHFWGNSNDFRIYHSSSRTNLDSITINEDVVMSINDGGTTKYPIWIDASTARFGIWNTSPQYPLDVSGIIYGNSNILSDGNFGSRVLNPVFPFESSSKYNFARGTIVVKDNIREGLEMRRARGIEEAPEDTVDGDILSLINSWGYYSRDWIPSSRIKTIQSGRWNEGDYPSRMYFGVTQLSGGEPLDIAFISERGGFNPAEDSSFTLGTGDFRWNEVYANTYYGDGSSLTGIPDRKVGVDSSATPNYIGATASSGVIRTGSDLTYADGGSYVTINVADNFLRNDGNDQTSGRIIAPNFVANGNAGHPTGIGYYVENYMLGDVGRIFCYNGSTYGDLAIGDYNGGNPNIMLKVGGNVGIGTGTPTQKLDINGAIRVRGSASSASIIDSGLTINEEGGSTAYDDFRVETGTIDNAFLIDASEDLININADISGTKDISTTGFVTGKKVGVFAYLSTETTTTCTTSGTYYSISGTFTNSPSEGFVAATTYTPGIKYNESKTQYFEIDWHATLSGDTNNITATLAIYKNGALVNGSEMEQFLKNSDQSYNLSGTCVVELAEGDEIQLVVKTDGDGDVLTLKYYTTTINEFFD